MAFSQDTIVTALLIVQTRVNQDEPWALTRNGVGKGILNQPVGKRVVDLLKEQLGETGEGTHFRKRPDGLWERRPEESLEVSDE